MVIADEIGALGALIVLVVIFNVVSVGAIIVFLAFAALASVPSTPPKVFVTGVGIGTVFDATSLHRQTVIRHLVRAGIELPRRGLTDTQARIAAELYVGGLTLVEVGQRLGVSEGTIRARLRRHGVARRPAGRRHKGSSSPSGDMRPRYDVTTR